MPRPQAGTTLFAKPVLSGWISYVLQCDHRTEPDGLAECLKFVHDQMMSAETGPAMEGEKRSKKVLLAVRIASGDTASPVTSAGLACAADRTDM